MWNLILLAVLAVVGQPDVAATRLDGTSADGQLQSWTANEVVVITKDGSTTIAANDLLELRFRAPASDVAAGPHVELVDGSILPISEYTSSDDRAAFELSLPSTSESEEMAAPLEQVHAVRLQRLEAEALPQWNEIRQLSLPSDVVVVAKRGGKSLDHLECVVGSISKDKVELTVDGQKLNVPREKVAGVIYYRSDEPVQASAVVIGSDGLRIAAAEIRLQADLLHTKTESQLEIDWPLAGVSSVDLSAGKVTFLGDLKPASAKWQPLIALPAAATRAAEFGQPRFNQSANGGALTLAYRDSDPAVASMEINTFAKGLALRSRTELVFRLPAGYRRLLAEAGIDPNDAASGNVQLSVFGDNELLVEHEIDGSDAPLPLDLDVAGVKRLRIVVDYGANLDTGDWLNLCNARIVK